MIRCAVLRPTPLTEVKRSTSSPMMPSCSFVTGCALTIASARRGPTWLTVISSSKKASSSVLAKPNSACWSSRTRWWVKTRA